ncbi:MAG: hypothetical protein ACQEWW_25810 [Bacillota bacterium]
MFYPDPSFFYNPGSYVQNRVGMLYLTKKGIGALFKAIKEYGKKIGMKHEFDFASKLAKSRIGASVTHWGGIAYDTAVYTVFDSIKIAAPHLERDVVMKYAIEIVNTAVQAGSLVM